MEGALQRHCLPSERLHRRSSGTAAIPAAPGHHGGSPPPGGSRVWGVGEGAGVKRNGGWACGGL
uniref:Uncharacterized protein n=1 Tax=Arundo donax TaxID=35708 RepID=A0A0A9F735_ARUDO